MATALLVIDMQRSLLDDGPWRAAGLVAAVRALVRRAHAAGAPVVFIRDTRVGPDGSIEASLPRRDGDLEFAKDFCDAFHGTGLHEALQERRVGRLVVCGMQTDYCIDTTCRRAASLGYHAQLVREAHSTFDHPRLDAEAIVAHHNHILRALAAGAGRVEVVDLDHAFHLGGG